MSAAVASNKGCLNPLSSSFPNGAPVRKRSNDDDNDDVEDHDADDGGGDGPGAGAVAAAVAAAPVAAAAQCLGPSATDKKAPTTSIPNTLDCS